MTSIVVWWQTLPGSISPVLFEIGPLKLRYYGLMYWGVKFMSNSRMASAEEWIRDR